MATAVEPAETWWRHNTEAVLGWTDLRFPATSINPAGQTNPATLETDVDTFPGTLLFSNTTDNIICGVAQLPHEMFFGDGAVIKPHIHWSKTTSATGVVIWEFTYRWIGNVGDAAEAWSTADNGTLAVDHGDTADTHALTAFTSISLSGRRASAMLAFRLYRRSGTDANDTYGANARLLELDFHYQTGGGKSGTLLEYPSIG